MKRRHVHRWAIWLLPLLLLRAFVPAGFMVSADATGLSLIICSLTSSAPIAAAEHSAHHHHDDTGTTAESESTYPSERSALCPFALAGSTCAHEVAFVTGLPQPVTYELLAESLLFGTLGPVRTDRIRGPPVLA